MSLSRIILRLLTLFFLLAGILLLRKPIFGQSVTAPLNSSVSHNFLKSSS
jgi:hypothetical protein